MGGRVVWVLVILFCLMCDGDGEVVVVDYLNLIKF